MKNDHIWVLSKLKFELRKGIDPESEYYLETSRDRGRQSHTDVITISGTVKKMSLWREPVSGA